MQTLGDDDKDNIHQTIDDEVLERAERHVPFHLAWSPPGRPLPVEGELTLAGATQPLSFDLAVGDDGR